MIGRGLGPRDDQPPSVVISRRLWQRRFGGVAAVVGQQIVLDERPYVVVGVADTTFQLPARASMSGGLSGSRDPENPDTSPSDG